MSAPPDPLAAYRWRVEERLRLQAEGERRHLLVSNLRLGIFCVALLLAWGIFARGWMSAAWLFLPAVAFAIAMAVHDRVLRRRDAAAAGVRHYEEGMARIEDRWAGREAFGLAFQEPDHPYAEDLDLFGKRSVFDLLCRARTAEGERTLASWLLAPAAPEEIRARQEAVRELAPRLDLREDLALLAGPLRQGTDAAVLRAWSKGPPLLPAAGAAWAAVLTAATAAGLGAVLLGGAPRIACVAPLAAQSIFAWIHRGRVLRVARDLGEASRGLLLLSRVMSRFEKEEFASPLLRRLAARLAAGGVPASRRIGRLAWLAELLEWRRNQAFAPLSLPLLWATHLGFAVERWRAASGDLIGEEIEVLGSLEALLSLSGYAYEHPRDAFPEVITGAGPLFSAEGLGHPLLGEQMCVRNDVSLDAATRLLLVSGSNMSGKTTLLRCTGVAALMAQSGAPVRAQRLRFSPLTVGASVRTHDSIHEGRSRFYAEIVRLRLLAGMASGEVPLLFLLDEILHGTNSHDRRIGAEAVIRTLIARGAIGMVTTHDLALVSIAEALAPAAANIHFQDQVREGRMEFDYRIHPGVVSRSNALALMRAVGLEIEEVVAGTGQARRNTT